MKDTTLFALTYLGTATVVLEVGGLVLVTDPAFDPQGKTYSLGPWYTPKSWFASEKTYTTPALPARQVDAVLVSHDQHADNLDYAGRKWLAAGGYRVLTTEEAAARLAKAPSTDDAPGLGLGLTTCTGLRWGASSELSPRVRVTATPARHGPRALPQVHEVIGFLIEVQAGPRIWISGDTVLFPALREVLEGLGANGGVDLAIVHCGGVRFPDVPLLGKELFTFDAAQAREACKVAGARRIAPVHREGWSHFREPMTALREAFKDVDGVRFLECGERWERRVVKT